MAKVFIVTGSFENGDAFRATVEQSRYEEFMAGVSGSTSDGSPIDVQSLSFEEVEMEVLSS